MLLYIHGLNQLNQKSAELESISLIRELHRKSSYPLSTANLNDSLAQFSVSPTDQELMQQARDLVVPTVQIVERLIAEKSPMHEAINLQRTVQILQEMPEPLNNNLLFAAQIESWQGDSVSQLIPLLNSIPNLRSMDEKLAVNQKFKEIFQLLLRNNEFMFNFYDIVNEAQLNHIRDLSESLAKGYLFHFSLEDELKKRSFDSLKVEIPAERIQEAEKIEQNILAIKRGVERAYSLNWNVINIAVMLYSYIKWFNSNP